MLIGHNRISMSHGAEASFLVWLLIVGATWLGISNAVREIVKELPIYQRERSVGLSIQAYVGSKVAVLGAITIVQCIIMTAIALLPQHLGDVAQMDLKPPSGPIVPKMQQFAPLHKIFVGQSAFGAGSFLHSATAELMLDVVLAGLAAMALGLAFSALARSSDQALVILPLILVTQVVLSQPFTAQGSPVLRTLGYVSSAQWGKNAASSTIDLNTLKALALFSQDLGARDLAQLFQGAKPFTGPELVAHLRTALIGQSAWRHARGTWAGEMFALVLLLLVPLLGTYWLLRRRDIHALAGSAGARAGPATILRRLGLQKAPAAAPQPAAA